jgi:hypothetical protein
VPVEAAVEASQPEPAQRGLQPTKQKQLRGNIAKAIDIHILEHVIQPAVRVLREARDDESRQRAAEMLEKAAQQLRQQYGATKPQ